MMERVYSDLTSFDAYPSTAAYHTQDEDGNPLQTEFGLSKFKDHQTLTVQEMPEKAPAGQLPRSVDIIADNDLVDLAKPGDRVQIIGNFRCMPGKQGGFTTGTFRTVLIANNVALISKEVTPNITGEDVQKCKKFSKQKGSVFSILSKSLAPSIHGHEYIKKALLCQLLGGVEKNLQNGTRLRGDINVLLIGDPSVAKSQLLRYVLHTAPRAVTTTGRGSSGVGLTAAVTTDQETGERRLEAGAMVLADRGIVCIDEFDKMTDMDRTAIHEVMEQGRVTISKAGIHARLNARCSVLAAANPVYGRYDPFKTPMENIGLQDSLLSRFDLLYILLDTVDVDSDRKIADHVVKVHQYRDPREADGSVTVIKSGAGDLATHRNEGGGGGGDQQKELQVWDKSEAGATGGSSGRGRKRSDRLLSPEFVQKYVEIAKVLKPVLTEEAAEMIGEEYSKLQSQDFENSEVARTQPVTARALETLIRLSTAHAKARLSKTVDAEDAETAIELVQFAYFKKVLGKPKKRRHQSDNEDDSDNDDNDEEASEATTNGAAAAATSQETTTTTAEEEEEEDSQSEAAKPSSPKRPRTEAAPEEAPVEVSAERLEEFKRELFTIFESTRQQVLPMDDVRKRIVEEKGFSNAELMVCIEKMTEDNKVMLSSNELYLI